MVKNLAKQAMTTTGQKACYVIDHLVQALANDPSSPLRRALILNDIAQYPGTTQVAIMERLGLMKSVVKREIDWLFDYGCIRFQRNETDGRSKKIEICGYSKKHFEDALEYFNGSHSKLGNFVKGFLKFLKIEKPTMRDLKILATLNEKKVATKAEIINNLDGSSASTDNRAFNNLLETGVINVSAV